MDTRVSILFQAQDSASAVAERVKDAIAGIGREAAQAQIGVGALGNALVSSLGKAIGVIGTATAALAGLGSAINKFGEFENVLLQIKSTGGLTEQQLKQMGESALQMGERTRFSATQAAQAMLELVKGGVSAADAQGAAAQATLDLAAATGISLPQAAEYVAALSDVWRELSFEQIANAVVQGANATTASVTDLRLGLAQVQSVGRAFGATLPELIAAIGAFKNVGSSGSDAGTALKVFFQQIANPTKEASKLMRQLGLSFFDAQGNFIGLANTFDLLRDKLSSVVPEDRLRVLSELFGTDAGRLAFAALERGGDVIRDTLAQMNALPSASEQAKMQAQGLQFALDELNAKFETLAIRIGERVAPAVIAVAGFIGEAVGKVSAFVANLDSVGEQILSALGFKSLGELEDTLGDVFAPLLDAGELVVSLFRDEVVPAVQTQLIPALSQLGATIMRNVYPVVAGLASSVFGALIRALVDVASRIFSVLIPALTGLIDLIDIGLKGVVVPFIRELANFERGVIPSVTSAVAQMGSVFNSVFAAIASAIETVKQVGATIAQPFVQAFRVILEGLRAISGALKAIGIDIEGFIAQGMQQISALANSVRGAVGGAFGAARNWFETNIVAPLISRQIAREADARNRQSLTQPIVNATRDVASAAREIPPAVAQAISTPLQRLALSEDTESKNRKEKKEKYIETPLGSLGQAIQSLLGVRDEVRAGRVSSVISQFRGLVDAVSGRTAEDREALMEQFDKFAASLTLASQYFDQSQVGNVFGALEQVRGAIYGASETQIDILLENLRAAMIAAMRPVAEQESAFLRAQEEFRRSVENFDRAVQVFAQARFVERQSGFAPSVLSSYA